MKTFEKNLMTRKSASSGLPRSSRKKKRVLVVDDEQTVLQMLERVLARSWEVDTAMSAEEALALVKYRHYDAVVTDFDMPGQDGIWLLSVLKEKYPQIRRILHSGSDPTYVTEHLADGTIDSFLQKPVRLDTLLKLV